MGGSGPTDIDALMLPYDPYADLDVAFAFENLPALLALPYLATFDAETEERRSGAMVNFMLLLRNYNNINIPYSIIICLWGLLVLFPRLRGLI